MVVQHNLASMNANRMLGVTTKKQSKSSEKLSSGYRINRAADDAAGLAISEKMRKQIKGLDRASTNAEDGVSSVQTAEGALGEVHSMLQRMNELAVQAANGTNSESDREAIQAEVEQLATEIDRVAETTKFNETLLLKGDADGSTKAMTLEAHDAGLKITSAGMKYDAATGKVTMTLDIASLQTGDTFTVAGKEFTIQTAGQLTDAAKAAITAAVNEANSIGADNAVTDAAFESDNQTITFTLATATVPETLHFSLHVGTEADMSNKIMVDIESMSATGLGIKGINVKDATGVAATYAIDAIADAITKVSTQRSALGAVQNRLEHTIANLDNVVENTTAAESRIRDTDMAEEMVEYSKNNILMQAGQSMLAQANQATQGVLSLLQ